MEDNKKGFFKRTAEWFKPLPAPVVEDTRSELPILGSPRQPLNPVNLTGTNDTAVSPDRALSLAAVYRAVTIIGTAVSQLPLGVWRAGAELPQSTTSLVVKPNIDLSLAAFLEETAISLAVSGNAYWLLTKSGPTGAVSNIEVLNPHNMFKTTDKNGKTVYRYGGKEYPDWKVKHLFLTRLPGFNIGVGPIQAAQNELRGALNLRNYADNWFTDTGVPTGILKTDQTLNSDTADAIRDRFKALQATKRDVAVLGSGVEYSPILLNPAEAQFLESQQFSITQIARMFGVPAQYLMTDPGNSSTYQNMTQVDLSFVRYGLQKYLTEIETAFSDLLPRGQEARFKVEALLRGDHTTRATFYASAITSGWMTVDEVRAAEGLLPLGSPDAPDNANNNTGDSTNGNS